MCKQDNETKQVVKTVVDVAIEQFDMKTIKVNGRIYVISIIYVPAMELEVSLRPLRGGTIVRTSMHKGEVENLGTDSIEAYQKAWSIAEALEAVIKPDIGEDAF